MIHSGRSVRNNLHYNEWKVMRGLAICLEAAEYPKDAADLTFYQKLCRLEKLTELNQQAKVNSVHISLNFHPCEQISKERLQEIAAVYMAKIGFYGQPYLLYQHYDAGHPHIHLVTTNIKLDGRRIDLHNIGRNQSVRACREIEIIYGLIRADARRQREDYQLDPVAPRKVVYGKVESKRAMSDVITGVVKNYRFGSLPELNAVLQLYNVCADRGSKDSRTFRHQGLVYRILDEKGKKLGVPVKASDFQSRPTLKYLSERFLVNSATREQHKAGLKNTIDLALLRGDLPLTELLEIWQKQGVDAVLRQTADGTTYGITYVDHRSRCVFNGSGLGKNYTGKAIVQRCSAKSAAEGKTKSGIDKEIPLGEADLGAPGFCQEENLPAVKDLPEALFHPEEQQERLHWQVKRKKKKMKSQQLPLI